MLSLIVRGNPPLRALTFLGKTQLLYTTVGKGADIEKVAAGSRPPDERPGPPNVVLLFTYRV